MVVLVTGCSSGFGRLTAVEAARRGHTVYAGVRRQTDDLPVGVIRVQLDVTVEADRQAVVQRIVTEQGRLDAVVNNAGVGLGGFLEDLDEDEIRRLFDVNVFAPWALTKCCLPTMRAQGSGTVVMVSSMAGRFPVPGLGAYAGSKFALEGLSEAWRHELSPFGIRVVLIEPGPYKTDIFGRNRTVGRRVQRSDSPYAARVAHLETKAAQVEKTAGDAQDVAVRICDVIEARRPRLRYPMGPGAKGREVMRRVAPFRAIEALVGWITVP